jgi:osmotically-inducible protein OsmY
MRYRGLLRSGIGAASLAAGLTASLAASLLIGLSGCNPQDASNLSKDTAHLAKDTGEALGSATLAGKVNTVLSLRKGVDMSGIHIDAASDGVVTLGGHVRNTEERQRVVETVNGIRGVDKVIDNLKVSP